MTKIQVTLSRHDDSDSYRNRGVSLPCLHGAAWQAAGVSGAQAGKWGLLVKKFHQKLFRSTSLPDCAMQAGARCSFGFY